MALNDQNIAIIGGGIIGLSCAWELARRGARVTVFDRSSSPRGASWAAAGMLAPAFEMAHSWQASPSFVRLCTESAALWPRFASDLERASGGDVDYSPGPALAVGVGSEAAEALPELRQILKDADLPVQELGRQALRRLEPSLAAEIEDGLSLPSDGRVNPRLVCAALAQAIKALGGEFVTEHVERVEDVSERFDACLQTQGHQSGGDVHPIKGVMLAFRRSDLPLDHVVRCGNEYAVPRGEHVLIGATVGEIADARGFLLDRAVQFLPRVRSAALVDQWSGVRPDTPDHAPLMGRIGEAGRFLASGHYRNGVLLAPITARLMADLILRDKTSELLQAFSPDRFAPPS